MTTSYTHLAAPEASYLLGRSTHLQQHAGPKQNIAADAAHRLLSTLCLQERAPLRACGTLLPNLPINCHCISACRKETHCEFCDSVLPDWKITLTPPCGADAPAVMNVNFDGEGKPAWLPSLIVPDSEGQPAVRILNSMVRSNLPAQFNADGEGQAAVMNVKLDSEGSLPCLP